MRLGARLTPSSLGPGTLSIRLGHLFDRVVVSDAGQANIAAAEKNLKPSAPPGQPHKFTFLHSPAEQLRAAVAPSSVDLACVGMAFHYFEAPAAIRALAATLRPGGTLAAATYGFRLRFPGHPGLARLWRRAAGAAALHLLRARRLFPAAVRGLAAAVAGLDAVPLPTELFEPGALRILVNGGSEEEEEEHPLCFVDEDRSCWEPAPVRIGATDVCRAVVDENWRRVADVDWLRGFLAGTQMGFGRETWESAEWRRLEEVVGAAPGGQVLVEWPVAMILATRNDKPA